MSDQSAPNQEPQITEEEAKQQLAEATAHLEKQVAKAKHMFSSNIKLADERIKFATEQLAEKEALRDQLAAYQDHPEGKMHFHNVELLCRVYGATKAMMEIEKACNQSNLAIVESEEPPQDDVHFAIPSEHVGYMEARSKVDYHMGIFLWMQVLEGIDVVMRTVVNQPAITSQSEEEEAWRQGNVNELKAAMAQDRELAMFLGQAGTELQETQALLQWAASSFRTILKLDAGARKGYLEDTDWAKLNAKVLWLGELTDKVQAFPALAKHFPKPEPSPLPYEQLKWNEAPAGTGRLAQARAGQTGRLGGQPGGGQTGRLPRQ